MAHDPPHAPSSSSPPARRRRHGKNPLAEILSRLAHDRDGAREPLAITFRHPGAPGDVRRVSGVEIARADRHGVELEDGTTVPLHRLLEVRSGEHVLWARGNAPPALPIA